jgi:hypothetical protein
MLGSSVEGEQGGGREGEIGASTVSGVVNQERNEISRERRKRRMHPRTTEAEIC